ncbi:MAG: hypothetical protein Q4D02_08430 [Clostridia bacterium]|nr:hypothetical protein [Clostridia bacterium]
MKTTTAATVNTKAPFPLSTYCNIVRHTKTEDVEKEFEGKSDEFSSKLGKDVVEVLGSNPITQNILLHAAQNDTLMNSYIIFVIRKSLAYQNATVEDKPYVFLRKIVPIWYREDFNRSYLNKRDALISELKIPFDVFLKLETYESFRNIAPVLKKSAINHLSDSINQLGDELSSDEIERLISDVA